MTDGGASAPDPADAQMVPPSSRLDAPARPFDIRTAFALILGRLPAGPQDMHAYRGCATVAELGAAMLRHPELPARLAALGVPAAAAGPLSILRRPPDAAAVHDIYELLLHRGPESEAAVAAALKRPGILDLLRDVLDSDEYRKLSAEALWESGLTPQPARRAPPPRGARPPRILLFGAFGNGNLGDAIQAGAVARLLPFLLGREDAEVAATSWLDRAPYPAPGITPWPRETIMDGWKLAGFDLILIGGGGLFAPIHFPLRKPAWAEFLRGTTVPHAVLGVGVAPLPGGGEQFAAAGTVLRRAVFATARSPEDLRNLQAIVPEGGAFPDPVLAAHVLGLYPARPPPPQTGEALLIVKCPANAEEAAFLELAARLAADHPGLVRVAAMEPLLDRLIAGRFREIDMLERMDDLLDACAAARLVVSARFHGCIAGVMAGAPTLGLGPRKCGDLFTGLGRPDCIATPAAAEEAILGRRPPPAPAATGMLEAPLRLACRALRERLRMVGIAD